MEKAIIAALAVSVTSVVFYVAGVKEQEYQQIRGAPKYKIKKRQRKKDGEEQ